MDNPLQQVCSAINEIAQLQKSHLLVRSKIYKSEPMATDDHMQQDDYINAVILLETELNPLDLLCELQKIEKKHKRVTSGQHWGPRSLDLDILLYEDQLINFDDLIIPHPGIAERDFVLVPLADIDPHMSIPNLGYVANLLKKCKSHQLVEIAPLL